MLFALWITFEGMLAAESVWVLLLGSRDPNYLPLVAAADATLFLMLTFWLSRDLYTRVKQRDILATTLAARTAQRTDEHDIDRSGTN